ncbi:hypothetical protein B0J13DRAFT_669580 [Dactylonectria estremocensis]|uniref:Uncharacterized protein n=1 Tax=Dactylonectria estremocensis TaxID=1079267 RepID=A0A9P9FJD6_9HYPO|nr:hypothetical protein B0J13DRAFT_669580 [Dactylonectria estremocensis]
MTAGGGNSGFIGVLGAGFSQVTNCLSTLAKPVDDPGMSKKLTQLQKQLEDFSVEKHQLLALHKALERELEETNERLERALQERDTQRRFADGGPLATSNKVSDGLIRSQWKQLDFNIRNLAYHLAADKPKSFIGHPLTSRLHQLSRSWPDLIRDDNYRHLLMMGYLWHVVMDQVFQLRRATRDHAIAFQLKSAQTKMLAKVRDTQMPSAPSLQRIARWCSQGAALSEELWGDNHRRVIDITKTETGRLRPFWLAQNGSSDRSEVKTWDQMKCIIEGATELGRLFMGSKALFEPRWGNHLPNITNQRRYDPVSMEATAWDRPVCGKTFVIFYTSPILYKIGNADGRNYDKEVVLVKASVVCD